MAMSYDGLVSFSGWNRSVHSSGAGAALASVVPIASATFVDATLKTFDTPFSCLSFLQFLEAPPPSKACAHAAQDEQVVKGAA